MMLVDISCECFRCHCNPHVHQQFATFREKREKRQANDIPFAQSLVVLHNTAVDNLAELAELAPQGVRRRLEEEVSNIEGPARRGLLKATTSLVVAAPSHDGRRSATTHVLGGGGSRGGSLSDRVRYVLRSLGHAGAGLLGLLLKFRGRLLGFLYDGLGGVLGIFFEGLSGLCR